MSALTLYEKTGPERRCIVRGQVGPKSQFIRFVANPNNTIVPDLAGKLPGRGVYVTADRSAIEEAVAKHAFVRALKRRVEVDASLVVVTEQLARRRVMDLLGLARKAGALVTGFEHVRKLTFDDAYILITASDAADDGVKKIDVRLRQDLPCVTAFGRDDLSMALGQSNVVHAAVIGSKNFGPQALRKLKIAVMWLNGLVPRQTHFSVI